MPSSDQHRRKAENNRAFLKTIAIESYPDWVVVAAFYTAVHLVEQVRAAKGDGDSVSHEDRLAYIQNCHAEIHSAYHILQNASMLARYQSNSDFFRQFQRDTIMHRLIDDYLAAIERYAEKQLKNGE